MTLRQHWWPRAGRFLALAASAASLVDGAQNASNSTPAVAPDVTVISRVTEMLEEMQTRSEQMKAEADAEHVHNTAVCQNATASTNESLSALRTQVETLTSDLGTLDVEEAQLSSEIQQHQDDRAQRSAQLELLRLESKNATQAFSQDLVTFNMAVDALNRAIEILQQQGAAGTSQGAAAAAALLELKRSAATGLAVTSSVSTAASRVSARLGELLRRSSAGATPTFDELALPSADSSPFSSQTGSVESLLENLRTEFQADKDALIASEKARAGSFTSEEASLEALIKTSYTSETEKKGTLAEKQLDSISKREELEKTSADAKSTEEYLAGITKECADREEAYVEMNKLREHEIEALGKAVALIKDVTGEALTVPALLDLPSGAAVVRRGRRSLAEKASLVAGKARSLLAVAADRLGSESLRGLVRRLGALVTATTIVGGATSGSAEDPLAKVRLMIEELIARLKSEATEEASHKAWCDGELEKATAAQEGAKSDVEKHSAKVEQLESSIASLNQTLHRLDETLANHDLDRNVSLEQHEAKVAELNSSIQDAEQSAAATGAAMAILQEYMSNVTKVLGLVHRLASVGVAHTGRRLNARLGWRPVLAVAPPRQRQQLPAVQSLLGRRGASERREGSKQPLLIPESNITGPQSGGIGMVVQMLEAVRDGYLKVKREALQERAAEVQLHTQTLLDLDVMIASAKKDQEYKSAEKERLQNELPVAQQSLNASHVELADADDVYEKLKPPCLNTETYEEKMARTQAEISSLNEALSMMEDMEQDFAAQGVALLQAPTRGRVPARTNGDRLPGTEQRARRMFSLAEEAVAPSGQERVSTLGVAHALASEHSGHVRKLGSSGRRLTQEDLLSQITTFLREIKAEVQADLQEDEQVYATAHAWCETSIPAKQTMLADELAHDKTLVTAIEVSTQQVEQLTVQLQQLEQEERTEQSSLDQHSSLRQQELEHFRESEKEMLQCISALKSALTVLSKHYDSSNAPSFNASEEQARLEAEKERIYAESGADVSTNASDVASSNASLLLVAGMVRKALQSTAGGNTLELLPPSVSATVQAFLRDPLQVVRAGGLASLSQTRRGTVRAVRGKDDGGSVDGPAIFGILQQLLGDFQADLQESIAQESQRNASFAELQQTKIEQIDAIQASIISKEQQLAHYTKVHAEAKEDLTYVRASYSADMKHLLAMQQHCQALEGDFGVRNTTRHEEIKAIDEAISVLEESAAANITSSDTPSGTVSNLLHGSRDVKRARALERRAAKRNQSHSRRSRVPKAVALKAAGVLDAYIRTHRTEHTSEPEQPARQLLSIGSKHAGLLQVASTLNCETSACPPRPPSLPAMAGGAGAHSVDVARGQAHAALTALATHVKHMAPLSGEVLNSMLSDALKKVIAEIDSLRSTLHNEQQTEARHRDSCIQQSNQVVMELEQRETLELSYNNTIKGLQTTINGTGREVDEIRAQISEMESNLNATRQDRLQEHEALKASVQEQLQLQKKLRRAMQALRNFYARTALATSLLQSGGSAGGLQTPSYVFSKGPQLNDGLEALCFPNFTGSLKDAQTRCKNEPECTFIYDEGCDGISWRYCKALPGGSNGSGTACTMLREEKATPVQTTFSKPLQSHTGSKGVLAILQILLDDSEQMIETITEAESNALDTYSSDVTSTQSSIQEKMVQITALSQTSSDAAVELQEAESSKAAVLQEKEEIEAYSTIVQQKCSGLLQHFSDNQEARSAEMERLLQAKQTLQGMQENSAVAALGLLAHSASSGSVKVASERLSLAAPARLAQAGPTAKRAAPDITLPDSVMAALAAEAAPASPSALSTSAVVSSVAALPSPELADTTTRAQQPAVSPSVAAPVSWRSLRKQLHHDGAPVVAAVTSPSRSAPRDDLESALAAEAPPSSLSMSAQQVYPVDGKTHFVQPTPPQQVYMAQPLPHELASALAADVGASHLALPKAALAASGANPIPPKPQPWISTAGDSEPDAVPTEDSMVHFMKMAAATAGPPPKPTPSDTPALPDTIASALAAEAEPVPVPPNPTPRIVSSLPADLSSALAAESVSVLPPASVPLKVVPAAASVGAATADVRPVAAAPRTMLPATVSDDNTAAASVMPARFLTRTPPALPEAIATALAGEGAAFPEQQSHVVPSQVPTAQAFAPLDDIALRFQKPVSAAATLSQPPRLGSSPRSELALARGAELEPASLKAELPSGLRHLAPALPSELAAALAAEAEPPVPLPSTPVVIAAAYPQQPLAVATASPPQLPAENSMARFMAVAPAVQSVPERGALPPLPPAPPMEATIRPPLSAEPRMEPAMPEELAAALAAEAGPGVQPR